MSKKRLASEAETHKVFVVKMRVYLWIFSVVILCCAGCEKKKESFAIPNKNVTVATVRNADVPLYLDGIGVCTAIEEVTIQPRVTGMVTAVLFEDGADVKKGQKLFEIDPRPYQAALDKALATHEQSRIKAVNDVLQANRYTELSKNRVIARETYDTLRSAAEASKAVAQADAAAVATAQLDREFCDIVSPLDGRTGRCLVHAGNLVKANETALLSIRRQDPILVDFVLPEARLGDIRKYAAAGTLNVTATPEGGEQMRSGPLVFLDNSIKEGNGTIRLRAQIPNEDRFFWAGQFVKVRVVLDTLRNTLLIPLTAVQVGQQGTFVFVVTPENKAEIRPITRGQMHGEEIVVTSGLEVGERIVTSGQLSLSPGVLVTIIE